MSDGTIRPRSTAAGSATGPLELGSLLFGRFKLIAAPDRADSLVGQGGMGNIHLAEDTLLDRIVAIKIPPPNVILDEDAKLDLLVETRQALALTHPNIVRIYDFHESAADGLWGISMQYVPGTNLSELRTKLSLGSRTRVAFSVERIKPWIRQICEALVHAHEFAGLVHRDLNPKNILLEARVAPGEEQAREHLLITDFGIAASIRHSIQRSGEQGGQAMDGAGTLPYMPWEQIMGERPEASNDVYALGATIYDLLTTRPPFFEGTSSSILTQIERAVPPSLVERRRDLHLEAPDAIPDEWEETVRDCLRKNPSERPASIRVVARRLGFELPAPISSPAPAAAGTAAVGPPADHASSHEVTTRSKHSHRTDSKRLSVVMFTDIVGSVALQQRLGTVAYTDFVGQHDRMIQAALSQAEDGEILSNTGDGFLLRFGEPSDAVETALRLQFLAQRTLVEGKPIGIRVGIHLGVITELQERVGGEVRRVGMALNLAARVMDIASGGQILLTRAVFDDARQFVREHPPIDGYPDEPEVVWMVHGDYLFKGSNEPLAIFEVGAANTAPLTSPTDGAKGKKVSGSGSDQIFPSLPPPAPDTEAARGADTEELESQREQLEKAQRELQAEIERLRESESKRDQELKLKEELLGRERERLQSLSAELTARREEEARAREELRQRAEQELQQARARSEQLSADLAARKRAFEAELEDRAAEMRSAAEKRLQELEDREREIVEREGELAAEPTPRHDPDAEQELEHLRRERDEFRLQVERRQSQLDGERQEFIRRQEEERKRAELQIAREAELKDEIHAAALAQLQKTLAEQEAEIEQQRQELALAEQQLRQTPAARAEPDAVNQRLVDQLNLESHRYANRIVQLNIDLEQLRRLQRRRLIAIATMSVLLAIAVGMVSARLIWGFWPWKLFEGSAVSEPSLVIEGLRRLEGEQDWQGLLAATIPAAAQLSDDSDRSKKVIEFARHAELQLAEAPSGRAWESDPPKLRRLLEQIDGTGWNVPPAHQFLIAKARLLEVGGSPRLAGLPQAVDAYLRYHSDPAEDERSGELDHDLNAIFAKLGELLAAPGEEAVLDEQGAQEALAAIPTAIGEKLPLLDLILGRLEIRRRLRQIPPNLDGALEQLDKLITQSPLWKSPLEPEIEAALGHLEKPDCPLPDVALLLDVSRHWDDSRLLTSALDRLESDDPAYEQCLTGLWDEFFRNRKPEARRRLPDDTSAWIGRLAASVPDLSLSGLKQLEELSRMGNAKAKLFLVDHYLKPGAGVEPSAGDLTAWRGLAEEALAGGEQGAHVQLGTICWRLADSDPDSAEAAPARDAAREHLILARRECPRTTDRDTATVLLAGLLSETGTDGSEQRREMAEVCFEAGIILAASDLPLAIRNWNKAKEADPNTARDKLRAYLESADAVGNPTLKEALIRWGNPTE